MPVEPHATPAEPHPMPADEPDLLEVPPTVLSLWPVQSAQSALPTQPATPAEVQLVGAWQLVLTPAAAGLELQASTPFYSRLGAELQATLDSRIEGPLGGHEHHPAGSEQIRSPQEKSMVPCSTKDAGRCGPDKPGSNLARFWLRHGQGRLAVVLRHDVGPQS